eukprot:jgi/Galph1/2892/GphlegSOOS_G1583.1
MFLVPVSHQKIFPTNLCFQVFYSNWKYCNSFLAGHICRKCYTSGVCFKVKSQRKKTGNRHRFYTCARIQSKLAKTQSAPNKILSFVALSSLTGIIVNRITTTNLTVSQERSDLVGVLVAMLIVVHILWRQDPQINEEKAEILVGKEYDEVHYSIPLPLQEELRQICKWITKATVAKCVIIQHDSTTLIRLGPFKENTQIFFGEIAKRCLQQGESLFLADLNILIDTSEFDYMPENCKSLYLEPNQHPL